MLFCHYGASLTDVPEDCAAIQSLLEELELTPEHSEDAYEEELQAAMAAAPRPCPTMAAAPRDDRRVPACAPVREYNAPDLEKTSMFGLFDDPYDEN